MLKNYSHVLTVAENNGQSIKWIEAEPFQLDIEPFPILKSAKVGDKFILTYDDPNHWLGRSVKTIEPYINKD